jgi:hypothetical protein
MYSADISNLLLGTNYVCQGLVRSNLGDRRARSIDHREYYKINFVSFERVGGEANLNHPYPTPDTFSVAVRSL